MFNTIDTFHINHKEVRIKFIEYVLSRLPNRCIIKHFCRNLNFDRVLELTGFLQKDSQGKTVWARTEFYTFRDLPFEWTMLVNVNLAGREPNGIVQAADHDLRCREIITRLEKIQTLRGNSLFKSVNLSESGADLIVQLNPEISLDDRIQFGDQMITIEALINKKGLPRGIHTDAPPGIIAVIGPGIRPGYRVQNAHVYDCAPTFLYSLGLPVARDLDGKILQEIFLSNKEQSLQKITVESFGVRNVPHMMTTTDADKRLKKELRALGYI